MSVRSKMIEAFRGGVSLLLLCCAASCSGPTDSTDGVNNDKTTVAVSDLIPERSYIIFDTDFGTSGGDIDDLGALAVLHALASESDCEVLAIALDHNHNQEAIPALEAVNTFYGRENLPLGYLDGQLTAGEYNFADYLAENFTHRVDSSVVLPATELYRKLLADQADRSVTIAVTGKLRNIANLLQTKGDRYSPLSGRQLVAQKVDTLFVMGGRYPESVERAESNFYNAENCAARQAIDSFPRPIVFNGFEVGSKNFRYATGNQLNRLADANPVKMGYQYWFQHPPDWASASKSDTITDWNIWDQITIHTAIKGNGRWFTLFSEGHNEVQCDGHNRWQPSPDSEHSYLIEEMDASAFSDEVIEPLMVAKP